MPTTAQKKQANDHIRDIRRRKGVDDPGGQDSDNVRDLDRALDLLSDQLYEKETHFLLELIQNADDNTFEDNTPTLSFHLLNREGSRTLLITCNEIGFEKDNIESLCRIGDSTKKSTEQTRGYIGEKGIGFKSVFKVANVVHIRSKAYSFKFDRRKKLGMIAPIIDDFPFPDEGGQVQTQILLQLNGKSEYKTILEELRNLEPQILIFLRKITKLVTSLPHFVEDEFKVGRVLEDQDLDGNESVTLTHIHDDIEREHPLKTKKKYLIIRRIETDLPNEERRPNVEETEVVLAFPIDKNMQPLLERQQTYSYLPIKDFGFNYLIQGDFLLTANRESVDSSEWNINVLKGVLRAFVREAVPSFNRIRGSPDFPGLRYTWPLYLQDGGGVRGFWSKLKAWLLTRLASKEILESRQNNNLSRPKDLLYIPKQFRLKGSPLVEDENSALHHLSFLYDSRITDFINILEKMDLKVMGISEFIEELQNIISKLGHSFLDDQSRQWHSKVAKLVMDSTSVRRVAHIPLIPLRDGQWVTPTHYHVFLEDNTSDAVIPRGVDIRLVDAKACRDSNRLAFFQWLGIKECDEGEVCRLIIESYNSPSSREPTLRDSVDEVLYLFHMRRKCYNIHLEKLQLYSAPPSVDFMYSKRFYAQHPGQASIISKYAEDPESNMPLLHPMYMEKISELGKEAKFVSWLLSDLQVSLHPRLLNERQLLTPEFIFLMANAAQDLLLLLRDHWDVYKTQLNPRDSSTSKLIVAMAGLNVACLDGLSRRLGQTVLPLDALKVAGPNLPFIDIPDPNNTLWLKFSIFGVLTHLSIQFYLRELKALAGLPVNDQTTKLAVQAVYAGLQSYIPKDYSAVRFQFKSSRLVFQAELKRWTYLDECVWRGPELSTVYNLSSAYPRLKKLFQTCLGVENVNSNHVIKELQNTTRETPFDRLKELLLLLNQYLNLKVLHGRLSKLDGKKIFPVRRTDGALHRLTHDSTWYLADRQSLLESFNGKLLLLDFDVKTVQKLKPLISALHMTSRLLSEADKSGLEKTGSPIYDEKQTINLSERAVHFLQLVPDETSEAKAQLLHRLRTLKVWGVPEIKRTHKVGDVVGTEEKGNVLFDDTNDSKLDIYISFTNTQNAVVEFELSERFTRYCGITDHNFQKLVIAILTYPLDNIGRFLDDHGFSPTSNRPDTSAEISGGTDSDEDSDSNHSPVSSSTDSTPTPGIPNPVGDTDCLGSFSETSVLSPSLRERIPTLDESISSIRITADLQNTTPTVVITPSQSHINPTRRVHGTSRNTKDTTHSATANEPQFANQTTQSTPSTPHKGEYGGEASQDAFDFGDFRSSFSEVFSTGTPSRKANRVPSQHQSTSHFRRSARTSGIDPTSDNSMQGIQFQLIGLLGETFVNDWLSYELQDEWDATRHWTSRNRNHVYKEHPFSGKEKDYADFTFSDTNGSLTGLLVKYGFIHDVETWLIKPPTYHLEVKSTTEVCSEAFYMSNNQVNKARQWTIPWPEVPDNVYMVIRVYNLQKETKPEFTMYIDPWAMYLQRNLEFSATDKYAVTIPVNL